jgi:hypothetical protein
MNQEPLLPEHDYLANPTTVQNTVRHTYTEKVKHTGVIQRGERVDRVPDLTFDIKGGPSYIELFDTVLWVKCKITKSDGSACNHTASSNADVVGPVNNVLHSMFSRLDIKINNNTAETIDNYPYRAYLEEITSFRTEVLSARENLQGWAKDTCAKLDEISLPSDNTGNKGFKARTLQFYGSSERWLCGRLHSSLFAQGRCIPPNTDIQVVLSGAQDKFVLLTPAVANAAPHAYRLSITDAYLEVVRENVDPSVIDAHAALKDRGARIPIDYRRVKITTETISAGLNELDQTKSLFTDVQSQLPDRIFLFFVPAAAYDGTYTKNPFNLVHADIAELELKVEADGTERTIKQEVNFTSEDSCKQAYYNFLREFGAHINDRKTCITLHDYFAGFTVFSFRVVSRMNDGEILGPIKVGKLSLKVKFRSDLKVATKLFALSEYRSTYAISPANLGL